MHEQGIVHGDLTPSNVAWFSSDFRWKLTGLEHACCAGEEASLPCADSKYVAPEIRQARCDGRSSCRRETSEDMWSFGIIASEVFKGTPLSFLRRRS